MFLCRGFPWEHESAVARSSADLLQQTADFRLQITRDHAGQTPLRLWCHDPGAIIGRGGHWAMFLLRSTYAIRED